MFDLFIKKHVKMAFFKKGVTYEEAYAFLEYQPWSVVKDESGNCYYSVEELKDAKNIRSSSGTEFDYSIAFGTKISESSDRELPETSSSRTESSSERDN